MLRDTENQSLSDNCVSAPLHRVRVEAVVEVLSLRRAAGSVETVGPFARVVVRANLLEAVRPQRRIGGARRLRGIRIDRDHSRAAADQNRKCRIDMRSPEPCQGMFALFE